MVSRRRAGSTIAALVGLLLAGCAGGSTTPTAASPAPTSAAGSTSAAPSPTGAAATTSAATSSTGAAAVIPDRYVGYWAPDERGCREPDSTIEGVRIAPREIHYHESLGVPSVVEQVDDRTVRVTARFDGEGQQWTSQQTLQLTTDDALTIIGPADVRLERVRCAVG